MTGVEAVSNGVQAFREPVVTNARRTLTTIIVILIVLLLGIAYLVRAYHIGATEPGTRDYQSVLSQLIGAVAGRGIFYWVSIVSILLVLCLSANTSFADFPRLCRVVASDGYLPYSFTDRGRRLVYSEGIWVLAIISGVLLAVFDGVTDRLIPLFAVGAFLAFTLSQSGMVAHWRKTYERGALAGTAVNAVGCGCHRPHGNGGGGRQVHGRRLDRGAAGAVAGGPDARRKASLSKNRARDRAARSEP
jgi:amino acid transporter